MGTHDSYDPIDLGKAVRKMALLERDQQSLRKLLWWVLGVATTVLLGLSASAVGYLLSEGARRQQLADVRTTVARLDRFRERTEVSQALMQRDVAALTAQFAEARAEQKEQLSRIEALLQPRRRRATAQ